MITERIISALKSGVIPWRKTWKSYAPMNYSSKRFYHGINFLLLSLTDFPSPFFLTFKNIKDLGGSILKGSKSLQVIFWKLYEIDEETETVNEKRKVPFLRYYNVFNISQTTLFDPKEIVFSTECRKADLLLSSFKAKADFRENFNSCFYNLNSDYVSIPPLKNFESENEYFASAFHELIHWTGNEKRLNRFKEFNDKHKNYSFEELVAEIGSAYLCAVSGVDNSQTLNNSAAYISGWLQKLENDNMLVYRAAAQAKKAADYILAIADEIQNEKLNVPAA
jgi:antirestriction protein ArdC